MAVVGPVGGHGERELVPVPEVSDAHLRGVTVGVQGHLAVGKRVAVLVQERPVEVLFIFDHREGERPVARHRIGKGGHIRTLQRGTGQRMPSPRTPSPGPVTVSVLTCHCRFLAIGQTGPTTLRRDSLLPAVQLHRSALDRQSITIRQRRRPLVSES